VEGMLQSGKGAGQNGEKRAGLTRPFLQDTPLRARRLHVDVRVRVRARRCPGSARRTRAHVPVRVRPRAAAVRARRLVAGGLSILFFFCLPKPLKK